MAAPLIPIEALRRGAACCAAMPTIAALPELLRRRRSRVACSHGPLAVPACPADRRRWGTGEASRRPLLLAELGMLARPRTEDRRRCGGGRAFGDRSDHNGDHP